MFRPLRPLAALTAFFLLHSSFFIETTKAQTPKSYTSSEILLGLKKLNVLGSVMYLAAHPDDENTRLIAYMANERLLETSYLSCTRGDGGQNLIGPELREGLGVIRTQELLAARRLDGGRQFFTRANDFGFSKTSDETFRIWDKEQVLADMVWVIRQRRPDVLITRFPPDARAGHGHHQASAILAAEAFDAAGDPQRFPEQLLYVPAWQPKRLLWNTGSFFTKPGENMDAYLKLDAGGYNALLGKSYGEIAALSRSQHRSQGMGSAAQRGEALEYFQPVKGEKATQDLFEGVDMTWNRVPGREAVGKLIDEVIRQYNPSNPAASIEGLEKVYNAMFLLTPTEPVTPKKPSTKKGKGVLHSQFEWMAAENQSDWRSACGTSSLNHPSESDPTENFWMGVKYKEIKNLIQACLGLSIEATIEQPSIVVGQKGLCTVTLVNRSTKPLQNVVIAFPKNTAHAHTKPIKELLPGIPVVVRDTFELMPGDNLEGLYWLQNPHTTGMYAVPEQQVRGMPELTVGGEVEVQIAFPFSKSSTARPETIGALGFYVPVQYKHTDPVLGELYQPLAVVPPVLVNLPPARSYVFTKQMLSDGWGKTVPVTLRAGRAGVSGNLALNLPTGWRCEPASVPFRLTAKDEELTVNFKVQPINAPAGRAELRAVATVDGQPYSRGLQQIAYPHIPTQFLFPEAVAPLVKLDLVRGKAQNVAYLMGAGDEVPDALRQIGYSVTLLKPEELTAATLKKYDALVVGIRAYNTVDRLKTQQPEILKYIEAGGNVVVQYVVNRGTVLPEIGPYPMTLSTDRVTVEDAPVTLTKHPLLAAPNKITSDDFKGWVQEQGLYYPSKWDPKYQTVISSSDPGEAAKESAILVADYGKGHFIHTGLSLFRELPAGVPGAYRLLANMVSYGK